MKPKIQKTELIISLALRWGVIFSAAIIAFGILLSLITSNAINNAEIPHTLLDFKIGLMALHPSVVIALGLLFLIALPIVRVGLTAVLFAFEKDYIYLFLSGLVFSILLFGVFFGKML